MILVDSSVWVDHLRSGDAELVVLLNSLQVLIHPFVLGELACGNLKQRAEVLSLLKDMPSIKVATDDEVLYFIERHALMGKGIGYVDAHLLAAVVLADGVQLWTRDKRLCGVAESLALAYSKI
ncbi:type II toxin-antitoxin system VapC family toxin [Nitrosomonas communis]|uniref:type II toxin-antitoxin system VapC family toxin n=1 Tax=Nitrosomonas communis TaxID=44574 RepID=UPI0026F2BD22|nr:type II toxin-antitoxin system VapC family toxin [Nitrosomonas communis]MCO6427907.1 type II toxin-antitoxin system VapC family toxin [Nitrosomonas communis]